MTLEEIKIVVLVVILLLAMVFAFANSRYLNKKMSELERVLNAFENRTDRIIERYKDRE